MRLFALTALTSAAFLTACGSGAPKTQAELLLGEWDQVSPISITQSGLSITISDGEVEFDDDGTSGSEMTMTIASLPEGAKAYRMEVESTYILTGNSLSETMTEGTVTPVTANAQSNDFAARFQAGMMQMPTSEATIVSLTDDTLVLRESESGAEVTYERS